MSGSVFWVSRGWGKKSLILGHIRVGKTLELPRIIRKENLKYLIPCLKYLDQVCAKCSFERHHLSNGNFHSLVMVLPAGTTGNKFAPQDLLCLFLDILLLKQKFLISSTISPVTLLPEQTTG